MNSLEGVCQHRTGAEHMRALSGMIRWKQAVDRFLDYGLTFGNPDFVRYAESYGARGTRVPSTAGLVPALEAAFQGSGVHLAAVPIDYSENTRVLVDELREKLSTARPLAKLTAQAAH